MTVLRENIEKYSKRFDDEIRMAKSDKAAVEALREKKRWLCRNDLFYLCCMTGNFDIQKLESIFKDFCDEVRMMNWLIVDLDIQPPSVNMLSFKEAGYERGLTQRLYLCHRTFFKTTILTKVHSLQLLLNFPNIRIALVHNTQENSSQNLVTIKNYFLNTPVGALFPECIPYGKEWGNMGGFSLANKTDSRSEDSIEAIGVGTKITGRHWDVAKKDDLVTEESVTTDEQREKVRDYDDRFNAGHFTKPNLVIQDYSGTRYHFADLYSVKKNDPNIKFIKIPLEDGKGNPTHPERFTKEDIIVIKSGLKPWVYNCQHLLEPEDPAKMSFKKEMIQYYDCLPECNYYLLVDPAGKRKKRSDFTAMTVVGIDYNRRFYIAEILRDKLDPKQRIDKGMELADKWKIKECGWEEVGLADDTFYLEEKRREKGLHFIITPIKSQRIAKEDRIRNILMPQYAELLWYWPAKGRMVRYEMFDGKNVDLTDILEKEFLEFPSSEHDDLLDTQTFLSQMTIIKPENVSDINGFKGLTFL